MQIILELQTPFEETIVGSKDGTLVECVVGSVVQLSDKTLICPTNPSELQIQTSFVPKVGDAHVN